jgi:hypothetical protein
LSDFNLRFSLVSISVFCLNLRSEAKINKFITK